MEAEHGHHRVADELLDYSAVLLDDIAPAGEVGVDHRPDVFGVEPARQCGEVDQVGEEHGHLFALASGDPGQDGGTTRPQRLEGGLDNRFAKSLSLCFEGGDGVVDRSQIIETGSRPPPGPLLTGRR
jgi:hypothetical protein